jgi:SpoVK/Ycf46/Vps4 family AAA+-type ATPase
MQNEQRPHQLLIDICIYLNSHDDINLPCPNRGENWHSKGWTLISAFKKCPVVRQYELTDQEVIILARIWFQIIQVGTTHFTAFEILATLISGGTNFIDHLDLIVGLLEKQVLYTTKKKIVNAMEVHEPTRRVRYTKRSLLEENISLHHSFISILIGEPDEVNQKVNEPYVSNKEYLSDWFEYTQKLYELHYYDYKEIKFGEELDETAANDLLDVLNWKHRIGSRSDLTEEVFPLQDIVDEYSLDENETVMLAYLVKEELDGSSVDIDELVKLISSDQHEVYQNRQYVTNDSKLVKRGIIEIGENVFLMSKRSEVRVAPDIMKQIILTTPINDEERLTQMLKGNDIFTLIEPNYSIDDLILAPELKQTILTSIGRYQSNVDKVLDSWQLYDGALDVVGQTKKKMEPGLLMMLHGPSGTGKTFASGAIAKHLGKKLLITNIARLQSMWVGESEKNIQRLFTIFDRIVRRVKNPPVLLLNEADQFLSTRLADKRSSIDQMQNSLQNLFLEGFERLRGVMIATTNMQDNIDSAFSRRFHLKLELPMPAQEERKVLWELHLPPSVPRSKDVNINRLAHHYILSGGQIKIIIQNAATEAASRSGKAQVIKQSDLEKYCKLEITNGSSQTPTPIGFAIA